MKKKEICVEGIVDSENQIGHLVYALQTRQNHQPTYPNKNGPASSYKSLGRQIMRLITHLLRRLIGNYLLK